VIIVLPIATPVSKPDPLIDAIAGDALVHVPPAIRSVNDSELPTHTEEEAGVIAVGAGLTVTVAMEAQPPMV
jgi:hypothetical protein